MLEKFRAYQMAKEYYWLCRSLKLSKFLQDQLLRASSSIALNIAEGAGKNSTADRKRFYSIALGSLRESNAILELEKVQNKELSNQADQLAAMLYPLSKRSLPAEH
jgi:four helix bundle protein